ncbi:hypothetical protein [Nonomuraea dietziae]
MPVLQEQAALHRDRHEERRENLGRIRWEVRADIHEAFLKLA